MASDSILIVEEQPAVVLITPAAQGVPGVGGNGSAGITQAFADGRYVKIVDIGDLKGTDGKDGQIRFTGHGAPGTIVGANPLDTYMDLDTGNIYKLT